MFCGNCGCDVSKEDTFCPNCGSRVEEYNSAQNQSAQNQSDKNQRNQAEQRFDSDTTQQGAGDLFARREANINQQVYGQQESVRQIKAAEQKETPMLLYSVMGVVIAALVAVIIWAGFQLYKVNKSEDDYVAPEVTSSNLAEEDDNPEDEERLEIQDENTVPVTTTAPATPSPTPIPTQANTGDYIFSYSNSSYLTSNEIEALSGYDMYLARNEIYARHGRKFVNQDLQQYFGSKSWYTPIYEGKEFDAMQDTLFNDYEKENIKLITKIEDKYGYNY